MRDKGMRGGIALLDAYSGSNLGDAAIVDSAVINLRNRLPGVSLSCVSLNVEKIRERHGLEGFPICATDVRYYSMAKVPPARDAGSAPKKSNQLTASARRSVKEQAPYLWTFLKVARFWISLIPREIRHFCRAVAFLRGHRLLVIAGGGQLDDEWGGPWGHPYALFKWTLAARVARVPTVVASVGACKLKRRASRLLIGGCLRMASFRSYRDSQTRDIVSQFFPAASDDPVIPDLALALPPSAEGVTVGIRRQAAGRRIVAVSPIAYSRPGTWATESGAVYERYVREMRALVEKLLSRNYFLLFVWSSMPDDRITLSEILDGLDPHMAKVLEAQSVSATITNWPDFVASVREADALLASRLHSLILCVLTKKPVVAISFDPKVDWLMEAMRLTDYLFDIKDFETASVLDAIERVMGDASTTEKIGAYRDSSSAELSWQFDRLAVLSGLERC